MKTFFVFLQGFPFIRLVVLQMRCVQEKIIFMAPVWYEENVLIMEEFQQEVVQQLPIRPCAVYVS